MWWGRGSQTDRDTKKVLNSLINEAGLLPKEAKVIVKLETNEFEEAQELLSATGSMKREINELNTFSNSFVQQIEGIEQIIRDEVNKSKTVLEVCKNLRKAIIGASKFTAYVPELIKLLEQIQELSAVELRDSIKKINNFSDNNKTINSINTMVSEIKKADKVMRRNLKKIKSQEARVVKIEESQEILSKFGEESAAKLRKTQPTA